MNVSSLCFKKDGLDNDGETRHFTLSTNCLQNAPRQRGRLARMRGTNFTILLVGESGLGKRTFVRSLFGSEFTSGSNSGPSSRLLNANKASAERCDVHRTSEIEVQHAVVLENGFETRLTTIFTPGYGDYTDNSNTWVPIASYIDAQHQLYMCQEEQPDRTQLIDSRVHACFFFLPPTHRVAELDWVAMKELSKRVNLIPVIAKADSMTREDLASFKYLVRKGIAARDIKVWTPTEGSQQLEHDAWPFGIVCSDELVTLTSGESGLGRKYRWGVVDIHDPDHSDFKFLRDFVFGGNMLDLIDSTETRFYKDQKRKSRLLRLSHALNLNNQSSETVRMRLASFKMDPDKADSIDLDNNKPAPSNPYAPRNSDLDVAEEVAAAMSGLELLSTISDYGFSFIASEHQEHDVILKQRIMALKAQFDTVVKFQEDRFDQQAVQLEETRDELSHEIASMIEHNKVLNAEIHDLENRKKR